MGWTSYLEDILKRVDDCETSPSRPKPSHDALLRWDGGAITLPKKLSRNSMLKCPHCKCDVKAYRLGKHITKVHRSKIREFGRASSSFTHKTRKRNTKQASKPSSSNSVLARLWAVRACDLADELGVNLLTVMNEAGRRSVRISLPSEKIPYLVAERIRRFFKENRAGKHL